MKAKICDRLDFVFLAGNKLRSEKKRVKAFLDFQQNFMLKKLYFNRNVI